MATQASLDLAQQLYVAYYGRPADPAGQTFWADAFDAAGDDLTDALASFGNSAEYTALSTGQTNTQLVEALYQQLFSRAGDAEGIAFYVDLLDTGASTLASIAKQIADGAQGTDATALANKVTVANTYTDTISSSGETYDSGDIAAAQAILTAVDDSTASVDAGNAAATAEASAPTFSLTASSQQVVEGETITYTVTASKAVDADTTFTFGVSGDLIDGVATAATSADYQPASGSVTVLAGATTAAFEVNTVADGAVEGLEGMRIVVVDSELVSIGEVNALIEDAVVAQDLLLTADVSTSTGSIDDLTGTVGNDTFYAGAPVPGIASVVNSLDTLDRLDGGDGTDSILIGYDNNLNITNNSVAPTATGIEKWFLSVDDGNTANVDLTNVSGYTELWLQSDTNADGELSYTGINSADVVLGIGSVTSDAETYFTYATGALAGTDDTVTLILNGATDTNEIDITGGAAGEGAQTVNLSSLGTAGNDIENLTVEDSAGNYTMTTLNIIGSADLNANIDGFLDDANGNSTATIDASALTGDLDLTISSGDDAGDVLTVTSGSGDDTLSFDDGAITVDGGAGDDSITTGAGNDTVSGGAGDDTIDAGTGTNTITGGDGDDTITLDAGTDTVDAGDGDDTVIAAANIAAGDSVDGGDGTDTLSVTSAYATGATAATEEALFSNFEALTISDALGADLDTDDLDDIQTVNLSASHGAFAIAGLVTGATVNLTTASANTLTITAEAGTVTGTADVLNLGFTNAASTDFGDIAAASVETINISSSDSDPLPGGDAAETMTVGLTVAATTLAVSGTNNVTIDNAQTSLTTVTNGDGALTLDLTGNANAVSVTAGDGDNNITGGAGVDTITVGDGDNTIDGLAGDNVITAGAGDNSISAGADDDTITVGDGDNTIAAGAGDNAITAGAGDNSISAGAGDDTITTGDGDNTIATGAGTNSVTTGAGDDSITGGAAVDTIDAGAGDDTITGAGGADSLTGGAGDDTFVFAAVGDSQGVGVDTINDFEIADAVAGTVGDVIDLSAVDTAGSYLGEANGYGAVLTSFTGGGNTEVVLDTSTSTLYVDIDGDSALTGADMAIDITGVTDLSATDFVF